MDAQNTNFITENFSEDLQNLGNHFGFQQLGVSDIDLSVTDKQLAAWISAGFHGNMDYMHRHGSMRTHPEELVPDTVRIITARMDYWPDDAAAEPWGVINDDDKGYISRYALGRDYHKLIRKRLQKLAEAIADKIGGMGYRVFTDSAPVMEKSLAQKSGLGWVGKHSNILNRQHGSYFFLGEIYTDYPFPLTAPTSDHCGQCVACIDICPTQAIVAPYQVDARRCISYLTIELRDSIPVEFRHAIGNRIYGCDDCQLVCPWNKFAQATVESDYLPRHGLDSPQLLDLFAWTAAEFDERLAGNPIRRIGYDSWLRNIAVALGNATPNPTIIQTLVIRRKTASKMVQEHIDWALVQQRLSAEL